MTETFDSRGDDDHVLMLVFAEDLLLSARIRLSHDISHCMAAFPNETFDTTHNARRLLLNDRTIDTDNSKDRPDEAATPGCSTQSREKGPYSRKCLGILWKPNGSLTCLSLLFSERKYIAPPTRFWGIFCRHDRSFASHTWPCTCTCACVASSA